MYLPPLVYNVRVLKGVSKAADERSVAADVVELSIRE